MIKVEETLDYLILHQEFRNIHRDQRMRLAGNDLVDAAGLLQIFSALVQQPRVIGGLVQSSIV